MKQYDPYDTAMTDEPERFYGQVSISAFKCVLVKGQGRVPYDPNVHGQRARTSTAIEFTVAHVDPVMPLIGRGTVNWAQDFKKVIRPSIEVLVPTIASIKGLTVGQFNPLREFNGMWATGLLTPQPDNDVFTCLKFDGIFPDEATCRAAYEADTGAEVGGSPVADLPFNEPEKVDPMRATLAAFLPNLWKQAQGAAADPSGVVIEMARLLEASSLLKQYFDIESPEVVALMEGTA